MRDQNTTGVCYDSTIVPGLSGWLGFGGQRAFRLHRRGRDPVRSFFVDSDEKHLHNFLYGNYHEKRTISGEHPNWAPRAVQMQGRIRFLSPRREGPRNEGKVGTNAEVRAASPRGGAQFHFAEGPHSIGPIVG